MPTLPVTVSITRHLEPGHDDEMIAWIRAGAALAQRFEGFLGSGWVRPTVGSDQWHMLYRFADEASLAAWEESRQRQWWLGAAQGLVGESKVERFTGIEGWFDPPTSYDHLDLRPGVAPPPRWKQAVTIFLVFFPLSLLVELAPRRAGARPGAGVAGAARRGADDADDDLRRPAVDHGADVVVPPRRAAAVAPVGGQERRRWPSAE